MLINSKRIYMNEADGSPGGGAATAAPAESPAAPATPAPTPVSLDQVKGLIAETLTGFKNEFFASARRAGVLGKEKAAEQAPTSTTQQAPGATAPTQGLSMADVEAMLERERVITTRATTNKLSDAQVRRMKSALSGVSIESVAAEADAYLADMGLVRTAPVVPTDTQPTTTAPVVQVVANSAPISDHGAPAQTGNLGWRYALAHRPMSMTKAEIAQMDAEIGDPDKARKQRLTAANAQAQTLRVVVTPTG